MQLIASTLFQDATPVASPIVELNLDDKVAGAVAVIKCQILAGKMELAPVESVPAAMPPMATYGQFLMEF